MPFAPIPDVLAALKRGEMVILVDDEDRENEGDLVLAAQFADAKAIAFMATRACGLICPRVRSVRRSRSCARRISSCAARMRS